MDDDDDEVYSWCEALAGDCAWVVTHSEDMIWVGRYGIHVQEYGEAWAEWDHGRGDGGSWGTMVLLSGDVLMFFPANSESEASSLADVIHQTWCEIS